MFKRNDKVRLKEEVTLYRQGRKRYSVGITDGWPSKITLTCASDEKDGYVDVVGAGISGAHLLAERLRLETADDLD